MSAEAAFGPLIDFPRLTAGDAFTPDPDDPATAYPEGAYITARWLPVLLPWRATAVMLDVSPQRLSWSEENDLGPVTFRARPILERTGEDTARLTSSGTLGRLRLPTPPQDFEIVIAVENLLVLRAANDPADMVSMFRMVGDVVQFHMRMPFGVAIHKSGVIHPADPRGTSSRATERP